MSRFWLNLDPFEAAACPIDFRDMTGMTVEQLDPDDFSRQVGIDGNAALVSWPLEFGGGTLRCCTNLAQPEWVVVPAPQNQYLDQPMVEKKFFRLSIP